MNGFAETSTVATDLSGFDPAAGSIRGTNLAASKEMGEPDHAGNAGGHSVWYAWTTYSIAVDGFGGKIGIFDLTWRSAPPNDNFADRIALAGVTGTVAGDSSGATVEPGEDLFGQASVWYSWSPPADGTFGFSTLGSRFDTVLSIYTGSSLESLELVGRNDDDPDRGCCSSWVPLVDADASTTYTLQVAALSEDGDPLRLSWRPLILGNSQSNRLSGTPGAEEIRGLGGEDRIRGNGGNDLLFGGRGFDRLLGGEGNDFLFDHFGIDILFGQGGNDTLNARDRHQLDLLNGGAGTDRCFADAGDTRKGCP